MRWWMRSLGNGVKRLFRRVFGRAKESAPKTVLDPTS
jgi:hypothetical protein